MTALSVSKPSLSPQDLTEAELVDAARQRSEIAVRELIRRLNPRLFRVARGILESDAEAEDAVQEAYLSAFAHLREFREDAQFSTWITRITINAARMRLRGSKLTESYDRALGVHQSDAIVLTFPGSNTESAEMALGRREIRTMLEAVVAELPSDLRLVFLMREAQGLSILEIARDLSLNPITVKTRLFRARSRLRASLEKQLKGGFETVFPFDGAKCSRMTHSVIELIKKAGHL